MEISRTAFRPIPALVPPQPVINAFVAVAAPLFGRLVGSCPSAWCKSTAQKS
jgi:type I restriction enzyme S subunit